MSLMDLVSKVATLLKRYPFSHGGVTPVEKPLSMDIYREWIQQGHHGSMDYLAEHMGMKEDPRKLAPRAQSAIVVAKAYYPHPYGEAKLPSLRTALYAHGEDYHLHFKKELEEFAKALKFDFPREEFLCFTDSAPILEQVNIIRQTMPIKQGSISLYPMGRVILLRKFRTHPIKQEDPVP